MFRSKYLALVAACAAMSVGSIALAADPIPAASQIVPGLPAPIQFDHPYMLDDTGAGGMGATTAPDKDVPPPASAPAPNTHAVLMQGFDAIGVGSALDAAHITIGGYAEGSWTYSAHPPAGNILNGRAFDTKTESIQFDNVDLAVTRAFDSTYKTVDFGFTIETMYGWDSAYYHSNGLSIYSPGKTASPIPGAGTTATIHPKAQFDLTQAYGTLVLPVGNGLGIQFGKWDTLLGVEVLDTNQNAFYSKSFIFQQEPFTHTGALAIYNLIDPTGTNQLVATAGFTRGWDQATKDDNGSIDYTGQLKFTTPKYTLTFSGITGGEEPDPAFGFQGLSGWRTELDFDASYKLADNFSLTADVLYGWENQTSEGGAGGGIGQWYGIAAYAQFVQSDYFTFNFRGEWFNDPDGAAPTQYLVSGFNGTYGKATGTPNQYYEVTAGVNITPLPSNKYLAGLHIRPEFRWDYSDHAAWNGGTQHDQWTGAIEAYFTF